MAMIITTWLHAIKESNYEAGKQAGLSEEALQMFIYANTEVMITNRVDPNTGESEIIAVDGRLLAEKKDTQ